MANPTSNYQITLPVVGSDEDQWGTKINTAFQAVDDLLGGDTAVTNIDINSGSIDGAPIGANNAAAGAFTTVTASSDITGNLKGDIKATDGTAVLDNGTDGTDATFTGAVTGNATTATTTATPRAFSVSGDVATAAGVDFNGSGAVDLAVTIQNTLWNKIYPEGSIYATTDTNFDPNVSFYGTWSPYAAGKVLVGQDTNDTDFDTINEIDGHKTHTLTVAQLPSHAHDTNLRVEGSPDPLVNNSLQINVSSGDKLDHIDENSNKSTTTSFTGSGAAHNNLQPYIVVKYWRRTG